MSEYEDWQAEADDHMLNGYDQRMLNAVPSRNDQESALNLYAIARSVLDQISRSFDTEKLESLFNKEFSIVESNLMQLAISQQKSGTNLDGVEDEQYWRNYFIRELRNFVGDIDCKEIIEHIFSSEA